MTCETNTHTHTREERTHPLILHQIKMRSGYRTYCHVNGEWKQYPGDEGCSRSDKRLRFSANSAPYGRSWSTYPLPVRRAYSCVWRIKKSWPYLDGSSSRTAPVRFKREQENWFNADAKVYPYKIWNIPKYFNDGSKQRQCTCAVHTYIQVCVSVYHARVKDKDTIIVLSNCNHMWSTCDKIVCQHRKKKSRTTRSYLCLQTKSFYNNHSFWYFCQVF